MSVKDRMLNAISLKCEATKHLIEAEVPESELIAEIIAQQKILVLLPHADESNIERWEKSLNVKAVSVDIEERRRYLLTLISSKLKVNTDTLAELSQRFTGVQALVEVEKEPNRNYFKNGAVNFTQGQRYYFIKLHDIIDSLVGKVVTISFDLRINSTGVERDFLFYHYQHSGLGIRLDDSNNPHKKVRPSKEWQTFSFSGEVIRKPIPTNYHQGAMIIYDPKGDNSFSVNNIKIEIGEHNTGFIHAPTDAQYRPKETKIIIKFLGQLPQVSLNRFTHYIKALIPAHLGVNLSVSAPMSQEVYLYAFTGISVSALKFE